MAEPSLIREEPTPQPGAPLPGMEEAEVRTFGDVELHLLFSATLWQRSATERRKESHARGAPRKAAVTDPNTPASGVDRIRRTVKSSRASPTRRSQSPALPTLALRPADPHASRLVAQGIVLGERSSSRRSPGPERVMGCGEPTPIVEVVACTVDCRLLANNAPIRVAKAPAPLLGAASIGRLGESTTP
jgi:hypothetical protein